MAIADTSGLHEVLNSYLRGQLERRSRQDSLPIPPELVTDPDEEDSQPGQTAPAIAPQFEVIQLADDESWSAFSRRFTDGTGNPNLNPWFRCLGVVRGQGAAAAVIEKHYVCLDYRSEFAAFYAHLDRPQRHATIRVHFFAESLSQDDVLRLSDLQLSSYLGYVVCRQGDLPLVGRSVLKTPAYVSTSTEINEPVNFFAQRLSVNGVPFMQQDGRFAVCAHVAAWVAHYTAYRRGLFERRLIADFVSLARRPMPMRSRMADGLTPDAAMSVLDTVGFRTHQVNGPLIDMGGISVDGFELPDLAVELGLDPNDPNVNVGEEVFANYLRDYYSESTESNGEAEGGTPSPDVPTHVRHLDALIDYVLNPYIASRWPLYGYTEDHAVAICGRTEFLASDGAERVVHFLHDDQLGPYLAATSLSTLSLEFLRSQSGRYGDDQFELPNEFPPIDTLIPEPLQHLTETEWDDVSVRTRTYEGIQEQAAKYTDDVRAILGYVLPLPARLHLQAAAARADAIQLLELLPTAPSLAQFADGVAELAGLRAIATVQEGIRFKLDRRSESVLRDDAVATEAYGSVHLAEWVVVVEGVDEQGSALWEIVYDGSSSDHKPRAHLIRVLNTIFVVRPTLPVTFESSEIKSDRFPAIRGDLPSNILKSEGGLSGFRAPE